MTPAIPPLLEIYLQQRIEHPFSHPRKLLVGDQSRLILALISLFRLNLGAAFSQMTILSNLEQSGFGQQSTKRLVATPVGVAKFFKVQSLGHSS